ncbi:ATP-dependent RNA helicase ded1-like isoform X1 [Arachis ipaensis]|uniref:ATP-dependent RNA helicase ded1-like isoform X1 n=1 Tax=Arachis ipaensis TaxID=130454 RepID=UPI0007AF0FE6|nr:ATP-dependent RNA helicase ded1-like isoform X1 [Arachis ipaensis]XP_016198371.1 ATP-dependent RNA helicase ded1-like isoform X1 [Arachis ipaensis]XP_016198372.1 ATP-dependent RNA helicase ded1-like isoform X1 [Arachis ipaensis]XP_020976890.1 ATP-dependent RNA helicase ded1-like isoform X1 [Arachis ipaensis]XP_020976891.1 ATP-dependent RNA helicase ded1-like isoform X1 [Arachis ipaensis]XP_020976892.1 ATP-dependent RNA helicase ded1-like isoform X1 [Arachis ipaensis]
MRSENRTPIFSFFCFSISLSLSLSHSLSLSIIPDKVVLILIELNRALVISRSHNSHRRSGSGSHNKTRVSDNESSDSNNGLTTGAIIGIIIGSILVAVILILALFFCVRKQKGKEKVTKTSSGSLPHGTTNKEGSWFHIRKTSLILYSTNLKITSRLHILCVMLVSFVVWSQFVCLYGGTSKGPQISSLKSGIDIVIGTPGCIQDLIEMGVCSLKDVSFVVLDEADRMLDMSFEQVVRSMLDRMH